MTAKELLDVDPQIILNMSEEELERYLTPFFPAARAPFVSKGSADTVKLNDGRRVKRSRIDAQLQQMMAIFKAQGNSNTQ